MSKDQEVLRLYPWQEEALKKIEEDAAQGRRFVMVWPRSYGKKMLKRIAAAIDVTQNEKNDEQNHRF